MFRSLPSVEQPTTHAVLPEPVPLSVLELDHPRPGEGWASYLHGRNIPVGEDDLGRPALSRDDARQLLAEQRKAEQRMREVSARQEQQAIEQDRVRFAQIWKGIDADAIPVVCILRPRCCRPQKTLSRSGRLRWKRRCRIRAR